MMLIVEILLIVNRHKMENLKTNWELLKKTKNPRSQQEIGCREIENILKTAEKSWNFRWKTAKSGGRGGKTRPKAPNKKPNSFKTVGHLYKTHLENRSSTLLILRDTTKKRACDIFYVTGSCLYVTKKIPGQKGHQCVKNRDNAQQTTL